MKSPANKDDTFVKGSNMFFRFLIVLAAILGLLFLIASYM